MSRPIEQLEEILQSHQKGIQDLISQEMSLYFYAHFLAEFPERENQVQYIFENVFKDTVRNLEALFIDVLYAQGQAINEADLTNLKATLQTYIHTQVSETKQKLWDRVAWIERLKT